MKPAAATPAVARILVVDDEQQNRDVLRAMLTPHGYEVSTVSDGFQALAEVERQHADLILLDVRMPGIDGIETCRRIRALDGGLALPIVFVTAATDRDTRVRGKQVGADDFLTKPIDEEELLARIRKLIEVKTYHELKAAHRIAAASSGADGHDGRLARLRSWYTIALGVGSDLAGIASRLEDTVAGIRDAAGDRPAIDSALDGIDVASRRIAVHSRVLREVTPAGSSVRERIDVRAVVEATVAMWRAAPELGDIRIEVAVPARPVWSTLEAPRVEHVLVNLISNAVDAVADVADPREIRVSLEVDATRLTLMVADTGRGIAPRALSAIFEPYWTTKPAGAGHGLGLVVVRNLVESAGGQISAMSMEGVGSTFIVSTPLEP